MTVNLEWSVAHELVSPLGSVPLNDFGGFLADGVTQPFFLLKPDPYAIVPALRAVTDNLSQADGTSLQPPYVSGLVASLHCEFWVGTNGNRESLKPACDSELRQMDFLLTLYLNALRTQGATPDGTQRLLWQPTGYAQRRMITQCLVAQWMAPQPFDSAGGIGMGVTFALATPFPYAIDETADDVDIADGTTVLVPNDGNAAYSPVVIVHGSTSAFAITREDTGEVVSYTGPDTITTNAEIDFFTANIATGGTDLIADLDPTVTEFFTIPPGGCEVHISGADCTFQSRAAVL